LKPDVLSVYVKIGAARVVLGEWQQAIDMLTKAIQIDPKNAAAHFNLGIAHYLSGDKSAAMVEYLRLQPLDSELANNLFDLMN
jgi:Flp pilus assembly protein TadD